MNNVEEVVIVGSGPAAHTAAIYAGRALLKPVLFEGFMAGGVAAGGQLTTTTEVENFPGFPQGIGGPDLMKRMREQSLHCGCNILTKTVDRLDLSKYPFEVYAGDQKMLARVLIIATGATAKRLGVVGEESFWQKGISACAVCDGALPIFRGKNIFVVGGGDTACEEALFLTKYAKKVYLVHRRDTLRASKIMQKKVFAHEKIEILFDQTLQKVEGDSLLTSVTIASTVDSKTKQYDAGGLFYAIGHQPNTAFLQNQLQLDESGYIVTKLGSTRTSVEGVFAAGDVQDREYRQAITAAGSGCMAFMQAAQFLEQINS